MFSSQQWCLCGCLFKWRKQKVCVRVGMHVCVWFFGRQPCQSAPCSATALHTSVYLLLLRTGKTDKSTSLPVSRALSPSLSVARIKHKMRRPLAAAFSQVHPECVPARLRRTLCCLKSDPVAGRPLMFPVALRIPKCVLQNQNLNLCSLRIF